MTPEEFRKNAHEAVDWVADYLENIEKHPVKSQVNPKDIYKLIPDLPPQTSEPFSQLMKDVNEKIIPGITHWQHPHFHAYFPGNSSGPSVIAEILTAGIAAQCMVWETSPAAAELEERMMEWLKEMMGLPKNWEGVIQDTASTATLVAIISAREKVTRFESNQRGVNQQLRVYCSEETHSSIEKAVKIAGLGSENLVKVSVDERLAMDPASLENSIQADLKNGLTPCCVVTAVGTTGTLAFDPVEAVGAICLKYKIWHHVDAAYAGSAMILPEHEWLREGLNTADSYVFNPHKWMLTNFDCSVYFVKDKEILLKSFEILPEYLKTKTRGEVNDYRDWGIQLGRRFRALKLWFVIRSYGVEGLQNILRQHISFGEWFEKQIKESEEFELMTPRKLNVVVLRFTPTGMTEMIDEVNEAIVHKINHSGKAYLTHTKINNHYAIRVVLGQTNLKRYHVENLWNEIQKMAIVVKNEYF